MTFSMSIYVKYYPQLCCLALRAYDRAFAREGFSRG